MSTEPSLAATAGMAVVVGIIVGSIVALVRHVFVERRKSRTLYERYRARATPTQNATPPHPKA